MKKMINNMALITVLMVFGLASVQARSLNMKVDTIGSHAGISHRHSQSNSPFGRSTLNTRAKTGVGMDSMCLALDLRNVELTIIEALIVPEYEAEIRPAIDLLYYHLEGTAEGESLFKLLTNKTTTSAEYYKAMAEIERSLQNRLTAEALWAFNVGLVLSDVYSASLYGDTESFANGITDLQVLVENAGGYASEKEIEILNRIVESGDTEVWTDEDYVALDKDFNAFLGLYFKTPPIA